MPLMLSMKNDIRIIYLCLSEVDLAYLEKKPRTSRTIFQKFLNVSVQSKLEDQELGFKDYAYFLRQVGREKEAVELEDKAKTLRVVEPRNDLGAQ